MANGKKNDFFFYPLQFFSLIIYNSSPFYDKVQRILKRLVPVLKFC